MKNIYHYHHKNKEFTGQSELKKDKLSDAYLLPAFSTDVAVIATKKDKCRVFSESLNTWSLVDDYRGYKGYDAMGNEKTIDEIGIVPDPTLTPDKPFILNNAKNIKSSEIENSFNAGIVPIMHDEIEWEGGIDSSLKIDLATRVAELAGRSHVKITDNSRKIRTLSINQANDLIVVVNDDYHVKFFRRQNAQRALENLPTNANQAAVDAITY